MKKTSHVVLDTPVPLKAPARPRLTASGEARLGKFRRRGAFRCSQDPKPVVPAVCSLSPPCAVQCQLGFRSRDARRIRSLRRHREFHGSFLAPMIRPTPQGSRPTFNYGSRAGVCSRFVDRDSLKGKAIYVCIE